MKKLTIILAAVVMGFVVTSCGVSTKDGIMKDVDQYFTDAEQELSTVDNATDFLIFAEGMSDRSDLIELLDTKYGEKTLSEADNEEVQNYIYDRATAYNHAEAEKCAEFLTPYVDVLEDVVMSLYAKFQANEPFDDESVEAFVEAFVDVIDFSDYDNIFPELSERIDKLVDLVNEMSEPLEAKIDELYPEYADQ